MAKLPTGRFPFISLVKAIGRAKAIFENDKSGKGLRMPVAFSAWGYSDKSSGGFQTVAALKGYGLVEDEGANDDRSIKLTEPARRYFQTEIEADKEKLEQEFALRPALMKHLFDHWGGGLVDDPVARTYLKTEIGLNEQSARSALGIYKENLSHVDRMSGSKTTEEGAKENSSEGEDSKEVYGNAGIGDLVDWEVNGVIGNEKPLRILGVSDDGDWAFVAESQSGLPMNHIIVREKATDGSSSLTPPRAAPKNPFLDKNPTVDEVGPVGEIRSERFDADEGVITISWPANLSTQSVEDIKEWIELLVKRIERRAKTAALDSLLG